MYISRNLEQWNAFLATLQTAFEQGKAQDFLTLLLTPDERDAVGLRLQIVAQLLDKNLSNERFNKISIPVQQPLRVVLICSKQWIRIL
jgi:trp operon repressor homolog